MMYLALYSSTGCALKFFQGPNYKVNSGEFFVELVHLININFFVELVHLVYQEFRVYTQLKQYTQNQYTQFTLNFCRIISTLRISTLSLQVQNQYTEYIFYTTNINFNFSVFQGTQSLGQDARFISRSSGLFFISFISSRRGGRFFIGIFFVFKNFVFCIVNIVVNFDLWFVITLGFLLLITIIWQWQLPVFYYFFIIFLLQFY